MNKQEIIEKLEINYKNLFEDAENEENYGNPYYYKCKKDILFFIQKLNGSELTAAQCEECMDAYSTILRERGTKLIDDNEPEELPDEPEFSDQKEELIWTLNDLKSTMTGLRDVVADFSFILALDKLFLIEDKVLNLKDLVEKLESGELKLKEKSYDPEDRWIDDLCCSIRTAKLLRELMGGELVPEIADALEAIEVS